MINHKIISIESDSEGAGKTTQAHMLIDSLKSAGEKAHYVKFPRGQFRDLILTGQLKPRAHMLLQHAEFNQVLEEEIKPFLKEGYWIISDRYIDSSYAYQGFGSGLDISEINRSLDFAIGDYRPARTVLLTVDEHISHKRLVERGEDPRIAESYGNEFQRRVREGYKTLAKYFDHRYRVVDASGNVQEVHEQIKSVLKDIIKVF